MGANCLINTSTILLATKQIISFQKTTNIKARITPRFYNICTSYILTLSTLKLKRKPAHRVETLRGKPVPDIVFLEQQVVGFHVDGKRIIDIVNRTEA